MRKSLLFVWACMGLVCLVSACKTSVKSKEWKLVWVENFDQKNSFDESVNKTFTAHVSGDYILYFSCKAKYVEKEYTFSIAGKKVTVKVKHYLGVEFVYTNQSSSMHGGGTIG